MSGSTSSSRLENDERRLLETELTASLGSAQEARWILEDCAASPDPSKSARQLAERRLAGEPLQHLLSHWGFRHLNVKVDRRALVPRPETEFLVELALREIAGRPGRLTLVDLGTGSGVIACSLAVELGSRARVFATDSSVAALELARENLVDALGEEAFETCSEGGGPRVVLAEGKWFEALDPSLQGRIDLVISNPPYLAASEWPSLEPVVRNYDPYEALVAGEAGTEAIEEIVRQAPAWLRTGGLLAVEIAPQQAEVVSAMATEAGLLGVEISADLAGRPRVLLGRR